MNLKDKVVIISGARQGMGLAIAKRLKKEGALLVLNDRVLDDKLNEVCQELNAFAAAGDLSDLKAIPAIVKSVVEKYGKIDAVVAQHAYINMDKFEEQSNDEWWKVVNTNLLGTYVLIRESIEHLKKSKGKVVVTSSYWGLTGWPEASAYASSKAGLISLVKSLGRELAPLGINVNGIAPGVINTPQLEVDAKNLNMPLSQVLDMYAKNIPLGRVGTSDEIASVVAFLLDPEQNAMVGQIVNANGGEIRSRA
jgi:NAD(P)-dependent dehydrogenase (short-subunit alcohol dehydrogenase family)